jgi:hypothetical protein
MHAHACVHTKYMRTTVEMKTEHRIALLALAAKRGQKGFSAVLAEAIEEYLHGERGRLRQWHELLSLGGLLPLEDAMNFGPGLNQYVRPGVDPCRYGRAYRLSSRRSTDRG